MNCKKTARKPGAGKKGTVVVSLALFGLVAAAAAQSIGERPVLAAAALFMWTCWLAFKCRVRKTPGQRAGKTADPPAGWVPALEGSPGKPAAVSRTCVNPDNPETVLIRFECPFVEDYWRAEDVKSGRAVLHTTAENALMLLAMMYPRNNAGDEG